ncbi:MAG: GNAT family protein [Rhodospirillaceae bacterium]
MTIKDLSTWTPRPRPGGVVLKGNLVRLEPLNWDKHELGLFSAVGGHENAGLWKHLPLLGPFLDPDQFRDRIDHLSRTRDWITYVIIDSATESLEGMFCFMRIREDYGSVEIGAVVFGYALQRTRQATEALYLMACHVFDDLGYRRYEWKCDDQNTASARAARRFGFVYEGTFRNDMVNKGRNRDTAWFSITDGEWPDVKAALEAWLSPRNFDGNGTQFKTLEEVRMGR